MHRTPRFLREESLHEFIAGLPGTRHFVTVEKPTGTDYALPSAGLPFLRGRRPTTSLKPFLFPLRERVASFWGAHDVPEVEPFTVVGVRNCDLQSLRYLDQVFLGGVCEDPFYRARRKAAFLVSVDCVPPQPSCFCTSVGVSPYPEEVFDLNLSPVAEGYVVVAGTDAGEAVLERMAMSLSTPTEAMLEQIQTHRAAMVASLGGEPGDVGSLGARLAGTEVHQGWERWAAQCVECGACTAVCPTCHCYYLLDLQEAGPAARAGAYLKERTWDSCLFAEYARMAGVGGKLNPRPRLRSRLSNRVLHKYVYSLAQYGMCGCLGCGRCDEACLGALSLREMVTSVGAAV